MWAVCNVVLMCSARIHFFINISCMVISHVIFLFGFEAKMRFRCELSTANQWSKTFTALIKWNTKIYFRFFYLHLNELMIAFSKGKKKQKENKNFIIQIRIQRDRGRASYCAMRMHVRSAFETWGQLYGQISNKHISLIESVWPAAYSNNKIHL